MAQPATLFRWSPFLHYDSIDLPVVRNDRIKLTSILRSASASLERIQNVFQPVVNVVHRETRALDVQADFNF